MKTCNTSLSKNTTSWIMKHMHKKPELLALQALFLPLHPLWIQPSSIYVLLIQMPGIWLWEVQQTKHHITQPKACYKLNDHIPLHYSIVKTRSRTYKCDENTYIRKLKNRMILKHMASEQTPKFEKVYNISEICTFYVLTYACMYNEWSN